MSKIVLPTKVTKAERLSPKKFIFYSKPKVGKTTALSKLENCLTIDLENGTDLIDTMKYKVNSLAELHALGQTIIEEGKPYKYIAIDTISKLEDWCEDAATKTYKKSNQGKNFKGKSVLELPNGAGYLHLRIAFRQWRDYIYTLADNIILVAHVKDKLIDKAGIEVSAKELQLTGKIKYTTAADADAIGYLYRQNDKMMINFQSQETIECGSRCPHLAGKDMEFDWSKIYID